MSLTTPPVNSGIVAFAPRARLLRLIGAELISDEVVAITELVKNAHDADASFVSIQFVGVAGSDGEIIVRDDGHGMDLDALLTRWMQPASSAKGREGARYTRKGRRTLGEKGVGRFATDKLAARLELVSRSRGADRELRSSFDWDEFDRDDERMLSDVRSRWELRAPDWLEKHGTVLRMTGLRSQWNERMFRRLCARLSRLVSPFGGPKEFKVLIESDEFPEYAGEVGSGFLDSSPYRIEAAFDGDQSVSIQVNGGRAVKHTWSDGGALSCGPVRVRLYAFDLETDALARVGPRVEVRAWLREWSGVSVYRDGFRVWPYGEPHDDWLRLDQRRVNNPTVKLSNNQIVGFVEIGSDINKDLRDQTNREGLIHNDAFADLQRFVHFSLQMLEAERQAIRHPEGKLKERWRARQGHTEAESVPLALENLAARAPDDFKNDLRRAAVKVRSQSAVKESVHRRTLEGFVDLAAAGQMASLVGGGMSEELATVRHSVQQLRSSLTKRSSLVDLGGLVESLESLTRQLDGLSDRVGLLTPGSSSMARKRGLDVPAELTRLRALFQPALDEANAVMDIDATKGAVLRTDMRPASFGAVISVLVRNSLDWKTSGRPLKIAVSVREVGDALDLVYTDTGKGVLRPLEKTLFAPMVSGRDGASGMGLTLARSIVESHGGGIELLVDGRRKGATFRITLPRKRSRATSAV